LNIETIMSKPHERLDEDSVVSEFVTNENAQNFTISEDDIAGASDDVDLVFSELEPG